MMVARLSGPTEPTARVTASGSWASRFLPSSVRSSAEMTRSPSALSPSVSMMILRRFGISERTDWSFSSCVASSAKTTWLSESLRM